MISCLLKPWRAILSVFAVTIGFAWITDLRKKVSTTERESVDLERKVAEAARRSVHRTSKSKHGAPTAENLEDIEFDWQKLLPQLADWNRGYGDKRQRDLFEKRLSSLNSGQLIEELDAIDKLDLLENQRTMLANAIFPALARQDPQSALDRFIVKAGGSHPDYSILTKLNYAIQIWAEKDPASTGDWLDRKIAGGMFETKSLSGIDPTRVSLEQQLFQVRFAKDPQSAERRVMSMSNEEAFWLMSNLSSYKAAKENPAAFANLVRQSLSETQSIQVIARGASQPSMDYAAVTSYLDTIQATPPEREAGVTAAIESIFGQVEDKRALTIEEVDAMRAWAGPDHSSIDTLTGKVLGAAANQDGMSYHEAAALIEHYHDSTGSDELLIGFLTSKARGGLEEARVLAERIADPEKRAQILDHLR